MTTNHIHSEHAEWRRKHTWFGYAMAYMAGLATAVVAVQALLL